MKRSLQIAATALALVAAPHVATAQCTGGTSVATDSFTGTEGNDLGANWTTIDGTNFVFGAGNTATPSDDGVTTADYWNANSFTADQYAQAVVVGDNSGYKGPAARMSAGGNYYVVFAFHASNIRIAKYVSGAQTELQDTGVAASAGDVLRIEVTGSAPNISIVACLDTGSGFSQIGTTVTGQSDHNSGSAGIFGHDAGGNNPRLDDWEGGNFGAGGGGGGGSCRRMLLGVGRC